MCLPSKPQSFFYGTQPAVEEVPKIKAAIQIHYASLDERVNARMAEYENALKAANIEYEQYLYRRYQPRVSQRYFHSPLQRSGGEISLATDDCFLIVNCEL